MSNLDHLPTAADVFAEMDAEMDSEAVARWQQTTLARAVANTLVAYRTRHQLSQAALADRLGMKRSAISRLELGEHNPSIETLERLAKGLGMRFIIDVAPPGRDETTLPPDVQAIARSDGADRVRTVIAAGF